VSELRRLAHQYTFAPAAVLAAALLIANVVALPRFGNPDTWIGTLAIFAPFALVALASTPPVLSGTGGLDLSIGPLTVLVNLVLVVHLLGGSLGSPEVAIPICLALGAAVGALNGFSVAVLRYPPVIATLCTFLVILGVSLKLTSQPATAPIGNWTTQLAHKVGPLPGPAIPIAAVLLVWLGVQRLPYYGHLMAIGGDDATAFSSGVDVTAVRITAYSLGGAFAGVAGIALTAVFQSADPNIGASYALIALAAVALGGTPVGLGGRGGLLGSLCGAMILYLAQNLLGEVHVASTWNQVVYGLLLLGGVVLSTTVSRPPRRAAAG